MLSHEPSFLGLEYSLLWGVLGVFFLYYGYVFLFLFFSLALIHRPSFWIGIIWGLTLIYLPYQISQSIQETTVLCSSRSCCLKSWSNVGIFIPVHLQSYTPHSLYKIESLVLKHSQSEIFTAPFLEGQKPQMISRSTHCTPHLKNSEAFFQAYLWGQYQAPNPWGQIMSSLGLAHLLCFSGWHAQKIFFYTQSRLYLFTPLCIGYFVYIAYSFPFLCAFFKIVLKKLFPKNHRIVFLAPLISLIFQPLSWTTWSFWLTIYYFLLIELKGFSYNILKISSIGWPIIFGQPIYCFSFLIGISLENYFEHLFCAGIILYLCSSISPEFIETSLSSTLEIAQSSLSLDYQITVDTFWGWIIITSIFIFSPNKEVFENSHTFWKALRAQKFSNKPISY